MYIYFIIYLIIGLLYLLYPKQTFEKYKNNDIMDSCNSELISKSINRIRKKYITLEKNLSDNNLI